MLKRSILADLVYAAWTVPLQVSVGACTQLSQDQQEVELQHAAPNDKGTHPRRGKAARPGGREGETNEEAKREQAKQA